MNSIKSEAEEVFALQLQDELLPTPKRQYKFHPVRKWAADFAWPELMVIVEIEGGTFSGGRHTRGQGFANDCMKYNTATADGWQVYRFTTAQVNDLTAITFMTRVLCPPRQRESNILY